MQSLSVCVFAMAGVPMLLDHGQIPRCGILNDLPLNVIDPWRVHGAVNSAWRCYFRITIDQSTQIVADSLQLTHRYH